MMIHGGMTFKNKKDYWKYLGVKRLGFEKKISWTGDYIDKALGNRFEMIKPRMPQQDDAKYTEWRIYFERHLPYLRNNYILIGTSLGGIFLAKYLSEHKLPEKALATYLVCPPFDDSHSNEDLAGGFKLKSDISALENNSKKLCLMFSADDECVPIYHAEKYRGKLPNAKIMIYKNKKGHFRVSRFPEIVQLIKEDARKALKA